MSNNDISGKNLCLVGKLTNHTHAQATEIAKEHGAEKVTSSMTATTDIFVTGQHVAAAKLSKAKKMGIAIWTEEKFFSAVGVTNEVEEKEEEEDVQMKEEDKKDENTKKKKNEEPGKKKPTKKKEEEEEEDGKDNAPANITRPKRSRRNKAKKGNDDGEEEEEAPPAKKKAKKATPPAKKKKETKQEETEIAKPTTKSKKAAVVKKEAPPTTTKAAKKLPEEVKSAAKPAAAAAPRARRVMRALASQAEQFSVYGEYDVKLMNSDSLNANSNKFYKLQLLQKTSTGEFFVATNWGRLGEPGQSQLKGPHDLDGAISLFSKTFRSKTKNAWGTKDFVRYGGKYQLVETMDDAGDDGSAALGRLTESQIHKGQAVLKQIRVILEEQATAAADGKRQRVSTKTATELGQLSNDYYSLIPTTSGRQRPPKLDNLEIITQKEGLLEFWLRMGFDEVTEMKSEGSPIDGCFLLPVPSTLKAAASNITDNFSITSSQQRGATLAQSQSGNPAKKMSKELYAAILLYTGNSIYRELNRVLRTEWKSVPKYWKYLRLYFEATDHMATQETTLWRGIAADLYDEYEEGKIITWWTVSSCTADKSVAENFMGQLGGNATLITLHTKTACDISSLSFFPHERESLLRPGTKLRVLSRKRKGKVAEIEVEEVVEKEGEKEEVVGQ